MQPGVDATMDKSLMSVWGNIRIIGACHLLARSTGQAGLGGGCKGRGCVGNIESGDP